MTDSSSFYSSGELRESTPRLPQCLRDLQGANGAGLRRDHQEREASRRTLGTRKAHASQTQQGLACAVPASGKFCLRLPGLGRSLGCVHGTGVCRGVLRGTACRPHCLRRHGTCRPCVRMSEFTRVHFGRAPRQSCLRRMSISWLR